jgi:hypothetical protein
VENSAAYHLSCVPFEESIELPINDYLKDDIQLKLSTTNPCYVNIINYIVADYIPPGANKKKIIRDNRVHLWDDTYVYQVCANGLLRRCMPAFETWKILERCHSSPYGGHYGAFCTNVKVWQSRFYWPTMYEDGKSFIRWCVRYPKHGNINGMDVMPLTINIEVEIFDVWGIDFMGPFPKSEGCKYILWDTHSVTVATTMHLQCLYSVNHVEVYIQIQILFEYYQIKSFPTCVASQTLAYKWGYLNSHSWSSCHARFFVNYPDFFPKVWSPNKFKPNSNPIHFLIL